MSEPILRALMQLFALISDIKDISEISKREKEIVRSFLSRLLNNELVGRYMKFFEECLDLYYNKDALDKSAEGSDTASYKAMRIKSICDNINEEFRQKQKIYLIIQLVDFISYGEVITHNELDFLMTVALALNIPENEYKNIKSFIIDPVNKIPEKEKLLLINNTQSCKYQKVKHIFNATISGELRFLNIISSKIFILRYIGDGDLYLNGQRIYSKQTYLFDNGSTIKGHGLKTVYYSEIYGFFNVASFKTRVSLTAKDLVFRFRDTENGIQNFNFHGESGQLVGILGVSGTGKSTLLDLLNGNIKPHGGEIFINGYNFNNHKEKDKLKGIIGYVPQDDLLIEELTVYENLYYSARMCLDKFRPPRIKKIVKKILTDLDLYEIKNLKVGDKLNKVISGGQRKRINIALELVREPHILFVDEPTSGLSSIDSEVVINLLKEQTYKGKLVIINIHQPCSDLYKLFDKIIILDKGGYQIYYGNPNEAIIYFKTQSQHANAEEDQCIKCGNINTEQVLQIVEAKIVDERGKLTQTRRVTPVEWYNMFREKIGSKITFSPVERIKLPESHYSIPGLLKQMRIFFIRDALSKLANKQYLIISLMGSPFLAFVLGYFTKYTADKSYLFGENENLPAFMFMCVITSLFLGLIISSEEILKDRKILKRESFLNLSWFSYINSKIGMMFLLSAIQTVSFIIVGNLILGIKGMTLAFWVVLFTTSCSANLLGLNISSALNSVITIYILIPFIIIPQLLFSGVMVKFDKLHKGSHSSYEYVPVIGDLMTARWSFEAMAVEQFKKNRFEKNFFKYNMEESQNFWYGSFLIRSLKEDLHECLDINTNNDTIRNNLKRLNYHINNLSDIAGYQVPDNIRTSLDRGNLDSIAGGSISAYLDYLKHHFLNLVKNTRALKDSVYKSLEAEIGIGGLVDLQANYENKQLKNIVILDRVPGKKSIRTDDRIIQKYESGYMMPVSKWGRAHFYAPYKKLGNLEIDTYFFNLIIIWAVSILLYFALYFKLLRKLITFLETLLSRKTDLEKLSFIIENPG